MPEVNCTKKGRPIIHGYCGTPTYNSWVAMKQRCLYKKKYNYSNYGGRGISFCKAWDSFEYFLKDMGERPKGTTLDRKNSNGNYEPDNCRWASYHEQRINRHARS